MLITLWYVELEIPFGLCSQKLRRVFSRPHRANRQNPRLIQRILMQTTSLSHLHRALQVVGP